MLANNLFDLFEVPFLRFQAGFDEGLEAGSIPERTGVISSHPILSDVETQKIEPDLPITLVERVDDAGLAGFQAQSHPNQPFFGDLLEFDKRIHVMVQDHEVIGVANDPGDIVFRPFAFGNCADQGLLEPMQSDIHEERRNYAALRDAAFRE